MNALLVEQFQRADHIPRCIESDGRASLAAMALRAASRAVAAEITTLPPSALIEQRALAAGIGRDRDLEESAANEVKPPSPGTAD